MFKIKSKGNFIVSVVFFIVISAVFAMKVPTTNLPEKSEIRYATGIFNIVTPAKFVNHVELSRIDGSSDSKVFSCAYNAFSNGKQSSCGDTKFLEPYDGNKVTIGWYQQKEFLGFENDLSQLVSIEMNGKTMKSYEEVVKTSKGLQYINIGLYVLIFILSVWLYKGGVRTFEEHSKNKMKSKR